jgi:SNF2 family DNA or RNA helicase
MDRIHRYVCNALRPHVACDLTDSFFYLSVRRCAGRLGQYRPIKVVRIIVDNSIESRILQLQEKKNLLFQSTVGMDASALSRLTEEDLRFLFIL